jgi:hypothetical protein
VVLNVEFSFLAKLSACPGFAKEVFLYLGPGVGEIEFELLRLKGLP